MRRQQQLILRFCLPYDVICSLNQATSTPPHSSTSAFITTLSVNIIEAFAYLKKQMSFFLSFPSSNVTDVEMYLCPVSIQHESAHLGIQILSFLRWLKELLFGKEREDDDEEEEDEDEEDPRSSRPRRSVRGSREYRRPPRRSPDEDEQRPYY